MTFRDGLGIQIGGWGNAREDRMLDEEEFERIPFDKLKERALSDFKEDLEDTLTLDKKVFFVDNPKKEGQDLNITFWNKGEDLVYRVYGPFHEKDWGKTWYEMEVLDVKTQPTKEKVGVARRGGTKITLPKDAEMRDSSEVLKPIYEVMTNLINKLFDYSHEEKKAEFFKGGDKEETDEDNEFED
jgi:hypothetical protein